MTLCSWEGALKLAVLYDEKAGGSVDENWKPKILFSFLLKRKQTECLNMFVPSNSALKRNHDKCCSS